MLTVCPGAVDGPAKIRQIALTDSYTVAFHNRPRPRHSRGFRSETQGESWGPATTAWLSSWRAGPGAARPAGAWAAAAVPGAGGAPQRDPIAAASALPAHLHPVFE